MIFGEERREVSLALVNLNAYPVITQVWIDNGELDGNPETAQAPILPLPPVFRLEPGQQRSLRLLATSLAQTRDRESLYWLNIYEIPPQPRNQPKGSDQPRLTVTLRTQMKVLYRPSGLQPSSEEAPSQLVFSLESQHLRVENPTPYYITLTGLSLHRAGVRVTLPGEMLAPFTWQHLTLSTPLPSTGTGTVRFDWINDSGAIRQGQTNLK